MTAKKAPAKPKKPDNNKRLAALEKAEDAREEALEAGANDPASDSIVRQPRGDE